jgi:hypothetical protein
VIERASKLIAQGEIQVAKVADFGGVEPACQRQDGPSTSRFKPPSISEMPGPESAKVITPDSAGRPSVFS